MENAKQQTGVPENAFRELKKDEQYEPLMSPERTYKEVTVWSVLWGVLMAVVFSAASAYLGLKVGQVFEEPPTGKGHWERTSSSRASGHVPV